MIALKVWEVVLTALPNRFLMDDTQAYSRMERKGGNFVSDPGVGGKGLWKIIDL